MRLIIKRLHRKYYASHNLLDDSMSQKVLRNGLVLYSKSKLTYAVSQ